MDLAVAIRANKIKPAWLDLDQINQADELKTAKLFSKKLNCVHFPLFPEVFISKCFDCILGNPAVKK